jgi:hypothetical protein
LFWLVCALVWFAAGFLVYCAFLPVRSPPSKSEFPIGLSFILMATWPAFLGLVGFALFKWRSLSSMQRMVLLGPSVVAAVLFALFPL